MKKGGIAFSLIILSSIVGTFAQVPNWAANNGKGSVYGYFTYTFMPGENSQSAYTYWQYGVTDFFDAGFDFTSGVDGSSLAFTAKFGYEFSKWFKAGLLIQPWFSSSDNFKYESFTFNPILEGSITKNGRLYWLSNTWINIANDRDYSYYENYWNIGYKFELKNGDELTPLVGFTHSWKFDSDMSPNIGVYYNHKQFGFYLWGGDLLKSHPAITLGIDILF